MRVLFVGNPNAVDPRMGGSHSYQNTVGAAIMSYPDFAPHERFYVTPVQDQELVAKMVKANKIELVWYLSPSYFEPTDAPFVITIWDLAHRQMPWFPEVSLSGWTWDQRQAFYSHLLPRASRIIVGSEHLAKEVDHFYHVDKDVCKVIPLPVHDDGLPKKRRKVDGPKVLFYPAQYWPHKNHVTLLDMMVELKKRGDDYMLICCGSDKGNLEYLKKYAESKSLTDQDVRLYGFMSEAFVKDMYETSYALVFASMMGPDNLPPLEAKQYGLPVICADYPGDHYGQITFKALDPIDAADKVEWIGRPDAGSWLPTHSPFTGETYAYCVKEVIDEFAKVRKLWGTGYRHT